METGVGLRYVCLPDGAEMVHNPHFTFWQCQQNAIIIIFGREVSNARSRTWYVGLYFRMLEPLVLEASIPILQQLYAKHRAMRLVQHYPIYEHLSLCEREKPRHARWPSLLELLVTTNAPLFLVQD